MTTRGGRRKVDDGLGHWVTQPGAVYSYGYHALGRPAALTRTSDGAAWVRNVVYGPAGELQQMQFLSGRLDKDHVRFRRERLTTKDIPSGGSVSAAVTFSDCDGDSPPKRSPIVL